MAQLLECNHRDGTCDVRLRDAWRIDRVADVERALESLPRTDVHAIRIDTAGLEALDLSCAALLHRWMREASVAGARVDFAGAMPAALAFIDELERRHTGSTPPPSTRAAWPARLFHEVGHGSIKQYRQARGALAYSGRLLLTGLSALRSWHLLRVPSIARHIHETGIQAIPIVALIAFLISVIVAYLGAQQLQQFGAEIFTVDLVAIAVLREMGVLLTSIIVAGRSGSAFAAELGVMRLNDEIDALESIGLDPYQVLVIPRLIALVISLPLLTVVADGMGLAGGALLCAWLIDVPLEQFIPRVQDALAPTTFWAGLVKAPVFALLIGMVGTYRGLQVRDSSRELGRLTTVAVVQSIFLVIFADAMFAIIFVELDF